MYRYAISVRLAGGLGDGARSCRQTDNSASCQLLWEGWASAAETFCLGPSFSWGDLQGETVKDEVEGSFSGFLPPFWGELL